MIKAIIKNSIALLLRKPNLIRIAFFTTFGHTIYRTYLIIYFINNILRMRYETGIELSEAIIYLINKIQEFDILGFTITFIAIITIGNFLLYPIGEAALIYGTKDHEKKGSSAISQGIKKFFVMLEFNGLGFAFGLYTFITIIIRIRIMGLLSNIILQIILGMWGLMVLFAIFFRPYTKYYIVTKNLKVFDAIKKSIYLTISNFWLTIKGAIFEFVLFFRFILNACIVVAVPLFLIYLAVFFNIIDNAWVEGIIRITTGIIVILIAYINSIFEAFFTSYRYQLFEKAEENID